MSRAERKRLEEFSRMKSGNLTLVQASELLGLSDRQTKRVGSQYGVDGTAGLVRRSRGRASNRQPVARALAWHVDRHSVYRAEHEATPAELLANQTPETQFGRALRKLGVRLILARSPQAKGRVERMNGTLQDRLV